MASLTTPLSVRLTEGDTAFLSLLEVDGAVTASDKIRALIRQARRRAEPVATFEDALSVSHQQFAPAVRGLHLIEQDRGCRSDVVFGLLATAEAFVALAMTAPGKEASVADLSRYEARLVEAAARLSEQLLRWALTPTAPAYDPDVVSRRIAGLVEILKLVSAARAASPREGHDHG
ncbi:MAG: hypothetical protein ACK41P_03520 [Asticcacaulis sp.]